MGLIDIISVPLDMANGELHCFEWFDTISEFIEDLSNWTFYFSIVSKGGESEGMRAAVMTTSLFESLSVIFDVMKIYTLVMTFGAAKSKELKKDKLMFKLAIQMIKLSLYEMPLLICATWSNMESQNLSNELQISVTAQEYSSLQWTINCAYRMVFKVVVTMIKLSASIPKENGCYKGWSIVLLIFTWGSYGNFLGFLSYAEYMIRTSDWSCGFNSYCNVYFRSSDGIIVDLFAWWGGNALLLVPCAICILCKGTCRRLKAIGKEQKEKRKAARDAGQLDDLKVLYKKFKWAKFCKRTWCCCCRKVEDKVIEEGEKFVQKE